MKTKEEVYVVIDSEKKKNKVRNVLEMFNQNICNGALESNYAGFPFFELDPSDNSWTGWTENNATRVINSKTKVTIKELRNILAAEYLKEGDVVVCNSGDGDFLVQIGQKAKLGQESQRKVFLDGKKRDPEYSYGYIHLDHFLRYATEEEKALLLGEPKRELETGKWYWYNKCLVNYQGDKGNHGRNLIQGYGFIHEEWSDITNLGNTPEKWTEATEDGVKRALERECVNRYGEDWRNVKIKEHACGTEWPWHGLNIGRFESGVLSLYNAYSVNGVLYHQGKWAEPLSKKLANEAGFVMPHEVQALERLHDTLHNNHGYTLESRLLTEARKVIDKLRK